MCELCIERRVKLGQIKYWGEDGQECVKGDLAALKEKLLKLDLLLLELEESLGEPIIIRIDGRNLTQ